MPVRLGREVQDVLYQIIETDHPFANQALTEIRAAVVELGGTLTPVQERKYVRAMEPYERWCRQRAIPSRPARA